MESNILSLHRVSVQFGGVRAVNDVTLTLRKGEFIGLIGPNGAGKSTLLNLISGSVKASAGEILFKDKSIAGLSPDRLCHLGISRTFQNIRLFPKMTAFENVALGLHAKPHYSVLGAFLPGRGVQMADQAVKERALGILDCVGLEPFARKNAGDLSYGLQRRLEIARAMATDPELLLLDEPAAGMNEDECENLTELIRQIHRKHMFSVILIEHHIKVVMDLCRDSRIYVLNLGELLAHGTPDEIQNHPKVINAYLGEKENPRERSQRRIPRGL